MAARTPSHARQGNQREDRPIGAELVSGVPPMPACHRAQFKLANSYFAGVGVPRDPAQALLWYNRAAQQGLPQAQHAVGIMLIGGRGRARPIRSRGYKWLLLAEKGGHPGFPASFREKGGGANCRTRPQKARRGAGAALSCRHPRRPERRWIDRARRQSAEDLRPTARSGLRACCFVTRQARP